MTTETAWAEREPDVEACAARRKVAESARSAETSGPMLDQHVRAANHEPLDRAIEQYLARRQDQEMALVDRGADGKTGTGSGLSWRGPESPIAVAIAGAVAAIVALLALAALAVRAIG
jgi:hypothetical protein